MDNLAPTSAPAAAIEQSPLPALVMDNSIHFKWLNTGFEAFSTMLGAINAASTSIRLETYIYCDDEVGQMVRAALVEACYRGVKVQVMVDALGSLNLPKVFWDPLIAAGGEFAFFNPLARGRWSVRDHRKVLVCDDLVV